jgi:hypothetical protein
MHSVTLYGVYCCSVRPLRRIASHGERQRDSVSLKVKGCMTEDLCLADISPCRCATFRMN